MLKNKILVVQKLFKWEGRDSNQIHRRLSKNHDCIRSEQISKESKIVIKKHAEPVAMVASV